MPTLQELEAEMRDLQERLRVTTALVQAMRAYESTVGTKVHQGPGVTVRRVMVSHRPSRSMSDTERAAIDLMTRTGAPAATADVVEEMRRQGMAVPEANAVNIISARLSNNKAKFKARRGVGYWFADRPWPDEEESLLGLSENEASLDQSKDASETALEAQA